MAYRLPKSKITLSRLAAYQRAYRVKYRAKNREHLREYHRKWYAENNERVLLKQQRNYWRNPEHARELCRIRQQAAMEKRTKLIAEAKNKPCADCGIQFPFFVMDFDHVRGKKSFSIGHLRCVSIERLTKEIAKCEVVCSNCHRIRTWAKELGAITSNT